MLPVFVCDLQGKIWKGGMQRARNHWQLTLGQYRTRNREDQGETTATGVNKKEKIQDSSNATTLVVKRN